MKKLIGIFKKSPILLLRIQNTAKVSLRPKKSGVHSYDLIVHDNGLVHPAKGV